MREEVSQASSPKLEPTASQRAFYRLWWLSLPLAGGGVLFLLFMSLRWVLDRGLLHLPGSLSPPWLALAAGLAVWLLLPASYYLTTAPADDERGRRLTGATRQTVQEFADWLALPLALAFAVARWGGLLALAGLTTWLLLAADDPGLETFRQAASIFIQLGVLILLYLIMASAAAVISGLWALLNRRNLTLAASDEAADVGQQPKAEV